MAIGSLVVNNKNSDQNHAKNAKVSIFMMDKVATSNNSVSMYLDTSVPPESVLEQQVAAKLRSIRWIVGLCRELWQIEDKYAQQYHKILGACCTYTPTRHRLPKSSSSVSSSYEIAMEMQLAFEKLLLSFGLMKTQVATSLQQDVLLPMENFLTQQSSQNKQLVQELLDASQQYKQAESRLLRLQEKRRLLIEASNDHDDFITSLSSSSSSSFSPEQEDKNDNNNISNYSKENGTTIKKSITRQKDLIAVMKQTRLQCASSRQAIQRTWTQLCLTEHQSIEFMQHKFLQHLTNVYNQMISQTRIFLEAIQNQLTIFQSQTSTASGVFNAILDQEEEKDDQIDVTEEEERILFDQFDACVLRTIQIDSLFQQFIHLETNCQRKFQQLMNTYNQSNWLQQNVSRRTSSFFTSMNIFLSQELPKLKLFHLQLTTNLQDPIGRALKFSYSKQNHIKQECLQALNEPKKHLQKALIKLQEKQQKLDKILMERSIDPEKSHRKNSSNNSYENSFLSMTPPRAAASAPMKFATSSSSMSINMSSFGLCTAVVTSKFAGRDTSSFSTAITSSSSSSSSSGVTSIQVLENDVLQAKALVKNLKTSYQLRLQEIKGTLEKASLGGLQTLQLMLKDYLRSVDKAVDTLKTCMSHTYTLGQAVQPEEDAQCVFPDKIWQVFLQRPSFKFNQEQDPTEEEVKQDDNEEIPVVWLKEDKPEQAEQPEQHKENLLVHVVQTNHLPVAACTVDTNTQALGAMRVMTKLLIDLIKKAYTEFLASEWRHHVDFVSVGCLFVTYVCLLVMLFKVQQAQRSISQLVLQHISTQDAQDFTNFLETAQISFISKIRSM